MTKITVCGICHAEIEREEQEGTDTFEYGYDNCEDPEAQMIWEYTHR